jgi:predicted amidohydrolase
VVETRFGSAGIAVCWELIRHQTIRRLAGRVRFAITGNQWWSTARNWPGAAAFGAVEQYNRYLSENAPVEFARLLGVPVLHASHCGGFTGRMPLTPWSSLTVPYVSEFVGATQIVDAEGRVLAARNAREGAGVVTADIEIGNLALPAPVTRAFWVPSLTLLHKLFWHHQNTCGKAHYRREAARRGAIEGGAHTPG